MLLLLQRIGGQGRRTWPGKKAGSKRRTGNREEQKPDHSPESKAIFAYPSQYLTALSSFINSYTHNWPFRNIDAGIPVRFANS